MKLFNDDMYNKIGKKTLLANLKNSLQGFFIEEIMKQSNRDVIVILNTAYEASKFSNVIKNKTLNYYEYLTPDFIYSDAIAKTPEAEADRINTLNNICADNKNKVVICNLNSMLKPLQDKKDYQNLKLDLKVGMEISRDELIERISNMGYIRKSLIDATGDFTSRGYVFEVFGNGSEYPIRIDFFDDTIEAIKTFDVDTQGSIGNEDFIEILPFSDQTEGFTSSIVDYLNNPIALYINHEDINKTLLSIHEEIFEYNQYKDKQIEILDFYKFSFDKELFINDFDILISKDIDVLDFASKDIELGLGNNLHLLNEKVNKYIENDKTVVICYDSDVTFDYYTEHINNYCITNIDDIYENKINFISEIITSGFIYEDIVFISSSDIVKTTTIKHKNNFKTSKKLKDITKINVGDYVVHQTHGIGVYKGITSIEKNSIKKDYLLVEYRGGDKLYIPASKIENISKYSSGDGYAPVLNKMGGQEFKKVKNKVRGKLADIASELLKLYANRESQKGFAFSEDTEEQLLFENMFHHDLTLDQEKAVTEVKSDMESIKPMDRLLCGDVGFGKTEVAFRAMFKAVSNFKQVAYLCPTTILSSQQYISAKERFEQFGIKVALLNRFVSSKETKETLKGIENGTVDIVFGTHRLLSEDVKFRDLGLLIVDEEQRFGVTHKEKIKQMKHNVDVLTLSATPIPRTMQMGVIGIRDLSVIETPPRDRLPIQTFVLEYNDYLIKNAIYKELSRNGQIYILYNNVEDIENKMYQIKSLVPELRICFAHGRMTKKALEDTMNSFINHEYDCLICTTIIETGIDIPNANTLIVIDADNYGLSQLYQIRGRVGRDDKQAYCYLLYRSDKILTEIATKRLSVIKNFTELGSGYAIAMRDLAIRGAGDILGGAQSGFVASVGIDMYLKMIEQEINRLKGIDVEEEEVNDKSLLDISTHIEDFISDDESIIVEVHKLINDIDSKESLEQVKEQIKDRFGRVTDDLLIYMHEQWLEKLMLDLEISNIKQTSNSISFKLNKGLTKKIDGHKIFVAAYGISKNIKMSLRNEELNFEIKINNKDKHYVYLLIDLLLNIENLIS